MKWFEWTPLWALAANIAGWYILQWGIANLFYKMPDRWFVYSRQIDNAKRTKSREELFYEAALQIRKWKDCLPDEEIGLFAGGFVIKKLLAPDVGYYGKWMLDIRRGGWIQWTTVAGSALFFLWNELPFGWMMVGFALAANLPFIVIFRYNLLRLQRIVQSRNI